MLSEVGRREEALGVAQEAADIYRALAESSPDAFTPFLAGSLNNLANELSAVGRREEAVDVAREAMALYVPLAQQMPAAFGHDFLISLNTLARVLDAAGHGDEAAEVRQAIAQMTSGGDGEEAGDEG